MAQYRRVGGVFRCCSSALALVLAAAGIAAGCGGSSSTSDPLVAVWKSNLAAPGMNVDPIQTELKGDGTYTTTRSTCNESGTWHASGDGFTTTPTAGTCGSTLNTAVTVSYALSADKNTLYLRALNTSTAGFSLVLQKGTGTLPAIPATPGGVTATVTNATTFEVTVSWTAAPPAAAYNVSYTAAYIGSQPRTFGVLTGTTAVIVVSEANGVSSGWQAQTNFTVTALSAGGSSAASAPVHP